ncbi:MAG: putative cytosolic protein [Nitrospirae bacterium]|jgi:uncharacterized protein (TIGR00106 family)|nr:putative cytosolic protein [Nitrospirota bacterium]
MLIEFSIVPIGTSSSLSARVAEVLDIVDSSGLPYKLTPMGTIVEGEWNDLMRLVRQCHRKMMKNEERVLTRILIDDRKGKTGRMDRKIRSVEKRLGRSLKK